MKKQILAISILMLMSLFALAQAPPTPPSNANSGGGPVGGNAPVGSGMALMLVMGAAYAGWKKYEEVR